MMLTEKTNINSWCFLFVFQFLISFFAIYFSLH